MTQLLDAASGRFQVKKFSERVISLRISMRKTLCRRFETTPSENGRIFIFLDAETLLPLRLAMQGVRFRLQLDRDVINTGRIKYEAGLPS